MTVDFDRFTNEQIDDAVTRASQETGLQRSYFISLRGLVRSRNERWRVCCGGNCDPCIYRIEETVDRAREILRELSD